MVIQESPPGLGTTPICIAWCRAATSRWTVSTGSPAVKGSSCRSRAPCLFPRLFLDDLQTAFDHGQLQFFSSLQRLRDPRAFAQYLAPLRESEWAGLRQTTLRGSRTGPELLGPLYPPRGHLQPSLARHRPRQGQSSLQGLSPPRPAENYDAGGGRVHSPLPAACSATASSAFATTVFSAIATAQPNWRFAADCLGVASTYLAPRPDKLDSRDLSEKLTGMSLRECPVCHANAWWRLPVLPAAGRAPPFLCHDTADFQLVNPSPRFLPPSPKESCALPTPRPRFFV
jgi:hypothetical protein